MNVVTDTKSHTMFGKRGIGLNVLFLAYDVILRLNAPETILYFAL